MAGNNDVCLHNAPSTCWVVSVPMASWSSSPCSLFITCHLSQHASCTQDAWTQICSSFKFCFPYHPPVDLTQSQWTVIIMQMASSLVSNLYIPAGHLNIDLPEHHIQVQSQISVCYSHSLYSIIFSGVNGINGLLNPVVLSIWHLCNQIFKVSLLFSSPFVLPFLYLLNKSVCSTTNYWDPPLTRCGILL